MILSTFILRFTANSALDYAYKHKKQKKRINQKCVWVFEERRDSGATI